MIDRDTVIEIAAKHCICTSSQHKEFLHDGLVAFVNEITQSVTQKAAEAEREACAQLCDEQHDQARTSPGAVRADACARAIRNRGIGGGQ